MSNKTPFFQWPYPTPAEPSDGPFAFQAALEAVETSLKAGASVALNRPLGNTIGTFNGAKPIRSYSGWGTTTTNSVGQFGINSPAGATCIMACVVTPVFLAASGETVSIMHLRLDASSIAGGISVQARNPNTSAALATVNVSYTFAMTYQ